MKGEGNIYSVIADTEFNSVVQLAHIILFIQDLSISYNNLSHLILKLYLWSYCEFPFCIL